MQTKNTVDYRNRVLAWFAHPPKDDGPRWIEDGILHLKEVERKKEAKGNGEAR
jgi:hypothetical protein